MTKKNALPVPLRDWIDDLSMGFPVCAVQNCRNRATIGRYCARCDEELRAFDVRLQERWQKRQEQILRRQHDAELRRRAERAREYALWAQGVWRRFEWVALLAVIGMCMLFIGEALAPWFRDLAYRIVGIFRGN